jgi:DTW domain-containing protein YfiP
MLLRGLDPGACEIIIAKKCAGELWDAARRRWQRHRWVVLYPSDDACAVEDLDPSLSYVVVMLDGTWPQARL